MLPSMAPSKYFVPSPHKAVLDMFVLTVLFCALAAAVVLFEADPPNPRGHRTIARHDVEPDDVRRSSTGVRVSTARRRGTYVTLKRGNKRSALPRSIICSNARGSLKPGSWSTVDSMGSGA